MCFNVKTQESSCIRISHSDYHFGALNGGIALYATTMSCYGGTAELNSFSSDLLTTSELKSTHRNEHHLERVAFRLCAILCCASFSV